MNDLYSLFYKCSSICTDTRNIEQDSLFVCLKGANFNGNIFAEEAIKQGAKFAIVDEEEYKTSPNIFLVDNCLSFLQGLANHHRNRFNIPVIGITGSNGKTSTKELINTVLSKKYNVLSTVGNLNNHIGVPLTLLKLNTTHEIAIIEMGANRFKDIEELCAIANPTHGIITNIGKAHLEGFGDFNGVLKTKRELYQSISESNGSIIYNNDDQVLKDIIPINTANFSYGKSDKSDVQGFLEGLNPYVALSWNKGVYTSGIIQTNMIGQYNFYNFLAAISFGVLFNVPEDFINKAIQEYSPENNRSQIKKTERNTLILDCYNANPTSMRSALESFALTDQPDKFFVIGDMLELGYESIKEHQNIALLCEELELTGFTVGKLFLETKSKAFRKQFESKNDAEEFLKHAHFEGSLILLKGSRGIGLEVLEHIL